MRGIITARGRSWRLQVSAGTTAGGKRRRISRTVRDVSKREAERRLRELILEIESGSYVDPTATTVAEHLDRWLAHVEPMLRPTTLEAHRMFILAYISPRIGSVKLSDLTRNTVQELYSNLLKQGGRKGGPLAPRTVVKVHAILRRALGAAVRWSLVARNVADLADPPRADRHEIPTVTPRQVVTLLAAFDEPWRTPITLAFYSGLRRSEILGLMWADIDLERGTLAVRRAYHRLDDHSGVVRPPKSTRSTRLVPLTRSTVALLRDHRDSPEKTAKMLDRSVQPGDVVFARLDGEPLRPDSLSQTFRRTARKVGLAGLRFHDARHHACIAAASGGDSPKGGERAAGTRVDGVHAGHVCPRHAGASGSSDREPGESDDRGWRDGRCGGAGTHFVTRNLGKWHQDWHHDYRFIWWARIDSNYRPLLYQSSALTD